MKEDKDDTPEGRSICSSHIHIHFSLRRKGSLYSSFIHTASREEGGGGKGGDKSYVIRSAHSVAKKKMNNYTNDIKFRRQYVSICLRIFKG